MSQDTEQNGELDFEKMMGELAAMKSDLANRKASRATRPSAPRSTTVDGEVRRTRTRRALTESQLDASPSVEAASSPQTPSVNTSHTAIVRSALGSHETDHNKKEPRSPHGAMPENHPEMRIDAAISDSTSSVGIKAVQASETSEPGGALGNVSLGRSESRRNPSAAPLPPKSAQRSRSISNSSRFSQSQYNDNGDFNIEAAGYPDNITASPRDISTPTFGTGPRKVPRPYPPSSALSTTNDQARSASPQLPTRSNSRNYSKPSPPTASTSSLHEQTPQSSPYGPITPPKPKSASRPLSRSNTLNGSIKLDGGLDQNKLIGTIAEDQEPTYYSSQNLQGDDSGHSSAPSPLSSAPSTLSSVSSPLPSDVSPPSEIDPRDRVPAQGDDELQPALRKQTSADTAAMYREHQQDSGVLQNNGHASDRRPGHSRSQSSARNSPEFAEDASGSSQQNRERGREPKQEENPKGMFSWARSRSKSKDPSRQAQETPSYPEYNPALIPTRSTSSAGNQRAKSLPRKPSNQNLPANNEAWPPYSPSALNNNSSAPGSSLQHNKSITKTKYGIKPPPFGSISSEASSSSLKVSTNMNTIHHEKMIRGMGMGSTPIAPTVLLTPQPSFPTTASNVTPAQASAGGVRNMALNMMKQDGSPSSSELQMQQRHQQLQQAQQLVPTTSLSNSNTPPETPTSPRNQTNAPQNPLSPQASAPPTQRLVATRIYVQTETDFKSLNLAPNSTALDVLHMLQQRGTFGERGDPRYHDRWTVFEYSKEFMIERPLRDFEVILDVMKTWEADKDNKMICKSFPARNELTAKEVIRLVGPAGQESFVRPHGWVHLETKKSKWVKRYLHITDTAVYHSKDSKFTGESMLCMLRNFDVYSVQVPRKKAPTKFGFALKSSDSIHMFETPEDDYIHYICTETGDSLREWLVGLRAAKGMFMYHANPEQIREGQKRATELMSSGTQEGLGRGNLTEEQVSIAEAKLAGLGLSLNSSLSVAGSRSR
ncbi:hypothetical protein BGZ80_003558 [Entomortierella chlamydospora]|uniref:PH domain-containing protein n=1 Tax=Entomortierella chlamydospora TaxID=101097 RepID=A0A9P6SWK9_9FUNG|nr:hypothetical protein BGZ80_003558 [Entomortierella chlamydospora]